MIEYPIINWMLAHWGTLGGTASLIVLLLLRFGPGYIQNLRERRLAAQQLRLQSQAAITQREHDLFARIDRKDEVLERLTGNHIQHLEVQLAKSTQFFDTAIEHLRTMTSELREVRSQVHEVRDISIEIKGKVS